MRWQGRVRTEEERVSLLYGLEDRLVAARILERPVQVQVRFRGDEVGQVRAVGEAGARVPGLADAAGEVLGGDRVTGLTVRHFLRGVKPVGSSVVALGAGHRGKMRRIRAAAAHWPIRCRL